MITEEQLEGLNKLLEDRLAQFHKVADELTNMIDPICHGTQSEGNLNVHLRMFTVLEYIKDISETLVSLANRHMPEVSERAEKIMTASGLEQVKYSGKTFTPDVKTYISVTNEDKPKVLAFLKSHPLGKELVSEQWHHKSFESFIKNEFLDNGNKPPPYIKTFDQKILKVRKAKG